DRLATALATCSGLVVHRPPQHARPSATFAMVTLPDAVEPTAIERAWRGRSGIAKLFTRAIGDYPYLAGLVPPGDTPNGRAFAGRTMTVSTAGAWSGQDIETVVQAFRAILR